jgi:hypothetical protein
MIVCAKHPKYVPTRHQPQPENSDCLECWRLYARALRAENRELTREAGR